LVVRALAGQPELVHVNETGGDVGTAARLLEFDSVHGRFDGTVRHDGETLHVRGRRVGYSSVAEPGGVGWGDVGVDILLECTGAFRTTDELQRHLVAGSANVVVAAPVEGVLNIVMGCNDDRYDPATDHVVTAASCTTHCLAPVVKVPHQSVGIERGAITPDVTNTQVVVDAPNRDLRSADLAATVGGSL
jgi:glyceraldehyde 3-phosphate dehydrogenase